MNMPEGAWFWLSLLLVIGLVALGLVGLGLSLARRWRSFWTRRRARVAVNGEITAEKLLLAEGWRVTGRQVRATRVVRVDGEDWEVELRADLLVERDGERCVAEVKTGDLVPDPLFPGTRRQLMEYLVVFGGERVLLVDVPAGRVREVEFPDLEA